MITLNIPRIALIKGIQNPYTYMVKNGFKPQTAKDLHAGRTKRLDFAHLEKLCRIFHCEPHDLYDYSPNPNTVLPGADYLAFLTKPKVEHGIRELTSGLPLKEMENLLAEVAQRYKPS